KIFICGQCSIVVGIGSGELFGTQSPCEFMLIESAVMIAVQAREQGGRRLLHFRKIERSVVIRIEHSNRIGAAGPCQGRQACTGQYRSSQRQQNKPARYHNTSPSIEVRQVEPKQRTASLLAAMG